MELPEAQKEFVDILNRVKDPATLNGFLGWVQENWFSGSSILDASTRCIHFKIMMTNYKFRVEY